MQMTQKDRSRKIVMAGGSGFLGGVLSVYFADRGAEVVILTRSPGNTNPHRREIAWDAMTLGAWAKELDGAEAVINLTGRTASLRYGAGKRREIIESRVNSTRVIGEAIANCAQPPLVWLNASTATIYKHTFGPAHDENGEIVATAAAKDDFSIEVALAWERMLEQAVVPGTRKIALRAATVLGTEENSVFPTLRSLARFGLGGRLGSGRQYVSWIHERDFCRAVEWIMAHEDLTGAINVAAPNPVTNAEMMRLMRKTVGVPFGLPEVGEFFLRTEVELIIKSRRVVPKRLLASGFQFEFPTMREAFADLAKH
jgi:uncharacterized protein (TIGR01777 family)